MVDFLYFGEANIFQENLDSFLSLAEELKLKGLNNTADQLDDVGFLSVKVLGARGLRAADFVTLSDPYVTVELGNKFLRTETCYNTLEPKWNRSFKL